MGEIADAILNGDMTEDGEWIGGGHGYPRSDGGYDDASPGAGKRRRGNARKAAKAEAARHGAHNTLLAMGFRQMGNPWHYQIKVPGQPAIDFWPSKQKRCMRNQVTRCTIDELRAFIASLPRAGAAL